MFQDSLSSSPDISIRTSTSSQQPKNNDQELGYIVAPSASNTTIKKSNFVNLPCGIDSILLRMFSHFPPGRGSFLSADITMTSQVMAEALGTFILVFCISGIIGNMESMGIKNGLMEYAATAGLTVIVIVYSLGSVSGAHVNPAVTFAFALLGPFPWSRVPMYIVGQVGGSVLATYAGKLVYGVRAEVMMTRPIHGTTSAFVVELIATFIVLFLTTALFNHRQSLQQLSGFITGVAIFLGVLISGPVSGGSMNPARSLGPALVSWRFDYLWIYVVGPTIGAVLGVLVFRVLRLEGWLCKFDHSQPQGTNSN